MDELHRIEALEAENERLRDENDVLKSALGSRIEPWLGLGLTQQEARLFGALVKRGRATNEQLLTAVSLTTADDMPQMKLVDVLVCKVRKKIRPFGIQIATIWGAGYELPEASRERAKDLCKEVAA